MLVVVLGYILGGLRVCNDMDGFYDQRLDCHLNYTPQAVYTDWFEGNQVNYTQFKIENIYNESG